MIMHTHVRHVGCHALEGSPPAEVENPSVTRRVELENRGAELEPLGPFRPTARNITPTDGENGTAIRRAPGLLELKNLGSREFEHPLDGLDKSLRLETMIDAQRHAE